MNTDKKIAVVTGASRGIGRAIALELASQGALVIINYNGSEEKAKAVKEEIEAGGGMAETFQCNVADFDACGEFIKKIIKTYGQIDILVNNAGVTKDGLLLGMSEADFDKVVDTNLKGTFNCIRHVARQMLKQRSGRIVNMASGVVIYLQIPYCIQSPSPIMTFYKSSNHLHFQTELFEVHIAVFLFFLFLMSVFFAFFVFLSFSYSSYIFPLIP